MNKGTLFLKQCTRGWRKTTTGRPPLATAKEMTNFLVDLQAKVYYGLKTMARKFWKYGQVESIAVHLKNIPIYHVNYKKEGGVKAQIHEEGVARVVAAVERNVDISKRVTMEDCLKKEEKQKLQNRKTPR